MPKSALLILQFSLALIVLVMVASLFAQSPGLHAKQQNTFFNAPMSVPDIIEQMTPLVQKPSVKFAKAVPYGSGDDNSTSAVVVGDLNMDNNQDLILVNPCQRSAFCPTGTIGVMIGNGDGTFQTVVTYGSGGRIPRSAVVADVDGDHHPDLLVLNSCTSGGDYSCTNPTGVVGVLLGEGDGTFQTASAYNTGGVHADSLAVTDVNGDGTLDLVVADECMDSNCSGAHGLVGVLLGNRDGTFQPVVTYDSGGYAAEFVVVADLNKDGKPDLILGNTCASGDISCASGTNGTLGVLLGNGDGTFQQVVIYGTGGGLGPKLVVVADVNGDSNPDLLVANTCASNDLYCRNTNGNVGVLLGNGDGTFKTAVPYDSGGFTLYSLAMSDVNNDGKADLVVVNLCASKASCASGGHGSVGVMLGNANGTFQPVLVYDSGGIFAVTLSVADVNGDAKTDIIVANAEGDTDTGGEIGILVGNGDGTFNAPVDFRAGGLMTEMATVSDLNLDGKVDLVTVNSFCSKRRCTDSTVGVLLNIFSASTTTKLTSSSNPSLINESVTFTATLVSISQVPNGQIITFYDGTAAIGTGSTNNGVATFSTSSLSAKSHSIKAKYSGDVWRKGSSGSVKQVVTLYPSTTTVSSDPNPSISGQAVTLTATVRSAAPGGPTGTVTFTNGTTTLGKATLNSGTSIITTTKLPVGTLTIMASYSGDVQSSKSSGQAIHTVNP